MRKKLSIVATGLIAAATISATAAPAHAQGCTSWDPTVAYVCRTLGDADPVGWANHYYNLVGDIVVGVVCDLWTCP